MDAKLLSSFGRWLFAAVVVWLVAVWLVAVDNLRSERYIGSDGDDDEADVEADAMEADAVGEI